jgi:hypothetical protein
MDSREGNCSRRFENGGGACRPLLAINGRIHCRLEPQRAGRRTLPPGKTQCL